MSPIKRENCNFRVQNNIDCNFAICNIDVVEIELRITNTLIVLPFDVFPLCSVFFFMYFACERIILNLTWLGYPICMGLELKNNNTPSPFEFQYEHLGQSDD